MLKKNTLLTGVVFPLMSLAIAVEPAAAGFAGAARAQARHEPQETAQHEGDVRPQDPAVGVALVDDDVAQAPQETAPALVARQ